MQREIKFRGKRLDTGEWVYGSLVKELDGWSICDWGSVAYPRYDVDPETVGQYTGLKDENGIEIYEGDIVNVPYGHHKYNANDDSYDDKVLDIIPCEIVFSEWRGFYPKPLIGKKSLQKRVGKRVKLWGIVREDEVIGNIYANPELLK